MNEKFTEIIQTNNSENLIYVFVKAMSISK